MKGDSTGYTCSAVPGTREVQVLTYFGGEKMEAVDRGPEWGNGIRRPDSSPYLKYMLRPARRASPVRTLWPSEVWSLEAGVKNPGWTQCKEAQTSAMRCLEQSQGG